MIANITGFNCLITVAFRSQLPRHPERVSRGRAHTDPNSSPNHPPRTRTRSRPPRARSGPPAREAARGRVVVAVGGGTEGPTRRASRSAACPVGRVGGDEFHFVQLVRIIAPAFNRAGGDRGLSPGAGKHSKTCPVWRILRQNQLHTGSRGSRMPDEDLGCDLRGTSTNQLRAIEHTSDPSNYRCFDRVTFQVDLQEFGIGRWRTLRNELPGVEAGGPEPGGIIDDRHMQPVIWGKHQAGCPSSHVLDRHSQPDFPQSIRKQTLRQGR